jgi:Ser/Thr protein kinase RdoA (MazF antagonist)
VNLDKLSGLLAGSYGLTRPVGCRLLRAYTNDVYMVSSPDERFVLKVYGRGWRTEPEVRYEVALLRHLSAGGLPIAAPKSRADGDSVLGIETLGGLRHAVLFEYAPGEKPRPPFNPPLYHEFGRAIARMHKLSDGFETEHRRRPLDLSHLIEEPVTQIASLLQRPDDREFLVDLAGRVIEAISAFAAGGLSWGPIHGDASLDNLHVTADGGVVLYDFDSGGPGWRSADLQGWAANSPEHERKWNAFRRGYSSIRPLKQVDLLASPYLTAAWHIWGIKIDLDNRITERGEAREREYLHDQVKILRKDERTLLRDSGLSSETHNSEIGL